MATTKPLPYSKLRERIAGRYKRKKDFALEAGLTPVVLSQRLNGVRQWKQDEIVNVCKILDIPLEDAHIYFFTEKVAILQQ